MERGGVEVLCQVFVEDLHALTPSTFLEASGAVLHAISFMQVLSGSPQVHRAIDLPTCRAHAATWHSLDRHPCCGVPDRAFFAGPQRQLGHGLWSVRGITGLRARRGGRRHELCGESPHESSTLPRSAHAPPAVR